MLKSAIFSLGVPLHPNTIHTTTYIEGISTIDHYLETGEKHLADQTAQEYADKLSDSSFNY